MMKQDLLDIQRLIDRGETAAALPILHEIVSRAPGYAAARLLLARALDGEGRHEEAVAAWRLVRALVPDSPTAITGLKRALRQRVLWSTDPESWGTATGILPLGTDETTGPDTEPDPPVMAEPDVESEAPVAVEPEAEPEQPSATEPEPASSETARPNPFDPRPTETDEPWGEEPPENIDELIRELETARIIPDPSVPPAIPEDMEYDVDDVVSETLARIYENQRHFEEAARVYEKLAEQQPDRAAEFSQLAADARAQAAS